MTNHLAKQTSPYLLQHAENPVDWYPWCEEALALAREHEKPIFLSIGYSACHWCHVMEHESFENVAIAKFLNEHFVSIKVDREERPDLDQIYMNAVQLMTGRGGWPMSMFLTPQLEPFYGGTYWPPHDKMGMPGFERVLAAVHDAWSNRREQTITQAGEMTERLQKIGSSSSRGRLDEKILSDAVIALSASYDFPHGGFGDAPKFPHAMHVQFLLRQWQRSGNESAQQIAITNLDAMGRGGIYDHLAGGFARYSVDARWLVPHFEKMLYDNALLLGAYLDGYLVTGNQSYAQVIRETADYLLNYMTEPAGGFHSTEDADSEGVEGKFYVWTPGEVKQVLGDDAAERFCFVYDVSEGGNFEGSNILNLPRPIAKSAEIKDWDLEELTAELRESRAKLLEVRDQRIRPGKDDKILASWNGLMINSMARAAAVLAEPRYLSAAQQAATFVLTQMRRDDGRLWHTYRGGHAHLDAYLDDYAAMVNALVSLFEADGNSDWISAAVELADMILTHFRADDGGFYFTAEDHEQLIVRNKDLHESSVPSGNSLAATGLWRLGKLTGRDDYQQAAIEVLETAVALMQRQALAAGQMLVALDMVTGPTREIVVVGPRNHEATQEVLHAIHASYIPNRVVAFCDPTEEVSEHLSGLLMDKVATEYPTVYVCEGFACQAPLVGREKALAGIPVR